MPAEMGCAENEWTSRQIHGLHLYFIPFSLQFVVGNSYLIHEKESRHLVDPLNFF